MIGIYKITSPSNKVYIGLSKDIESRWKGYSIEKKTLPQQKKLYYSFKKYGIVNHKFEVIEECNIQDLEEREIFYIKLYDSFNLGLNSTRGGNYFWENNIGKIHTSVTINKMKEYWEKNSKPRSKETIEKISLTKRLNPRITTPDMIQNCRNASTTKKPINQLDLEGNFIKEWESINEASRKLNIRNDGISSCLRKKQKTSYGFKWEYKNNL